VIHYTILSKDDHPEQKPFDKPRQRAFQVEAASSERPPLVPVHQHLLLARILRTPAPPISHLSTFAGKNHAKSENRAMCVELDGFHVFTIPH